MERLHGGGFVCTIVALDIEVVGVVLVDVLVGDRDQRGAYTSTHPSHTR